MCPVESRSVNSMTKLKARLTSAYSLQTWTDATNSATCCTPHDMTSATPAAGSHSLSPSTSTDGLCRLGEVVGLPDKSSGVWSGRRRLLPVGRCCCCCWCCCVWLRVSAVLGWMISDPAEAVASEAGVAAVAVLLPMPPKTPPLGVRSD